MSAQPTPAELIQRKRDGAELSAEEIGELVLAYARDDVPHDEMAAFCMAVIFRGLYPGPDPRAHGRDGVKRLEPSSSRLQAARSSTSTRR